MLRVFVLLLSIQLLISCQWEKKKPSFLVIAIDSFPFEAIKCQEMDKLKGFKYVCDEMIRFTHAYTPSVLSQPALTSLLTGKYPFEHGVWNNGSSFLSAKFKTSSEVALQKGYRTFFISGGPPIWRKSGLDQGFEVFDDHISVDISKYYRGVLENVRAFLRWYDFEVYNNPFYAFLYLADLQFRDIPTVDNEGYAREISYEGQLSEIDESLEYLFENLKKKKKWDNTWIVVVGLNGISKENRETEFNGSNLFHENTNVALYIKPATTAEHEKSNWKIDSNVTLVDVGRTLYHLLNAEFYETHQTLFKSIDLRESLANSKEIESDRVILFESGWPQWRKLGRSLFALQKQNYLMLYENPPKIFNTLIDRAQMFPIDYQQSFQILTDSGRELINLLNLDDAYNVPTVTVEKMRLAHSFFNKDGFDRDYLEQAKNFYRKYKDTDVAGWLASFYIGNQLWESLLELGYNAEQSDWVWLGSQNKTGTSPVEPSICVKTFMRYKSLSVQEFQNNCSDNLTLGLFNWVKAGNQKDFIAQRDSFLKLYRIHKTDYEIQKLNYQNGYVWDTAKDKMVSPHTIELILGLPEFSRYKTVVSAHF